MLRLAVCPHDTETAEGINRWQNIAKDLIKLLGEEIVFEPFKNFQDELEKLHTQTYHIYYANLNIAYELFKKGYKAVGTYKEEKDRGIFLKRRNKKLEKYTKIATVKVPTVAFPSAIISNFDLEDLDILFFNSFKEALNALRENIVDLVLIHYETYKQMKKEEWFEEFISVDLPYVHFFMVHPDVEEKVSKALLSLPYVEKVRDFEFQYALVFNKLAKAFLESSQATQIKKVIDNFPYIMHLVYKDTIVYANDAFCKTLGYKKEEILNTNLIDYILDEKLKEEIKENIKKHLKGEKTEVIYPNVKLLAKDGSSRFFNIYCGTVVHEGSYGAYLLGVDVTKEKKLETLKNLLYKVNRAASGSLSEQELYQRVCKALVDEVGLKMVWVGAPGENKWFRVLYSYGFVDEYLDDLKIYSTLELPDGIGPIETAFSTGEVTIIDDTRTNPKFLPWREKAIERGYLSVAAVPLKRKDKVISVLVLYAEEPNFFDEETREILEQLGKDLSLNLEFIEQLKNYTIISTALESSDTWVMVTDTDGNILYVNDAVTKISGYSKEELLNQTPRIFKSGYQNQTFYKQLWDTILSGKEFESVFVNRAKSGELFYLEEKIIPVTLPDGTKRFVAVGKDVTKVQYMSEELIKLYYHDPLTELPNYVGFEKKLEDILPQIKKAFFVLLDIYGMSFVNYTYGVKKGDLFLKEIARRLKENLERNVIVGRIGGDEFGVLIPSEDLKDLSLVLDAIDGVFKEPVNIENSSISVGYNASVVIYPEHGKNLDELYEHATVLLKEAKLKGEGTVLFYEEGTFEKVKSYIYTRNLVKKALDEKLFVFYYQPYYDLKTMQIAGLEALVRIRLPDGSIVPPAVFIKELEEGPYYQLLSFEEWEIEYLCRKSIEFGLPVSINLSARTISKKDSIFKLLHVKERLKSYKVELVVEITERSMLEIGPSEFLQIVEMLKRRNGKFNVKIAIDDFGTGYSSLSYIMNMPIDVVKLDMKFVHPIETEDKARKFLENVIRLLKDLGFKTLAEGVETYVQLELIKDMGCDYAQGYFLSKPLSEEEVKNLLNK